MTEEKAYPEIEEHLQKIEEEYDVEILTARDFGSKAWNLDSENSDHDVGFIFKQNPLEHVKGTSRQNIDRHFEFKGRKHTFMGWSVARFFEMVKDSNPTTIEFLNSSLVYREIADEKLRQSFEKFTGHVNSEFNPIGIFYHYRSMAEKNYQKYIQKRLVNTSLKDSFPVIEEREDEYLINVSDEEIFANQERLVVTKSSVQGKEGTWHENTQDRSVKRHVYVLRAILYARYVSETHRMPPLNFPEFLEQGAEELKSKQSLPEKMLEQTKELAELKKKGEGELEKGNPLKEEIEKELSFELDNPQHNVRGVETEKADRLIEEIYSST